MSDSPRGILLDIEGTMSSISFVHDEMFPFARKHLMDYLKSHWGESELNEVCEQIAVDAGHASFEAWSESDIESSDQQLVANEVHRLMDQDVKATGLKLLQGLIWDAGFASGVLRSHLFEDVPPALEKWSSEGRDLRIYSSGSVLAQQLFFGHTTYGNLLNRFNGHYDTTTGSKRETESYRIIAADYGLPAGEILFLSDVVAELTAAQEAGMQTGLSLRPGNRPVPDDHGFETFTSFADVL